MDSRTTSMVTFETELGQCALRWTDVGISGVLLPKAGGRPGPSIEDGVAIRHSSARRSNASGQ